MFPHFNRRGKCEWLAEGGLSEFVAHYNREIGSSFSHTECLDIVRIAGVTPKRPEVLATDPKGRRMVIERKSVAWPADYIERHAAEHELTNLIARQAGDRFHDNCYVLELSDMDLEQLNVGGLKKVGKELGNVVAQLRKSDLPVRGKKPVRWAFRKAYFGEHDGYFGIVISMTKSMGRESVDASESAKIGTASALRRRLEEAALKFSDYADARKVVLLDFYGTELDEEDIPPLLDRGAVPNSIDEIWMSVRDWVSDEDFEIGYQSIFERESSLNDERETA
jgi:hypothetical protein